MGIKLKPCDVMVIRGSAWSPVSWPIMWRSLTNDTHCVVLKDTSGNIYDPTIGGVLNRHISYYKDKRVKMMRYNHPINTDLMIAWANKKQATAHGYDYRAWLGFATGIKAFTDEDRWFCSEFPYWMYEDNGYHIMGEKTVFPLPSDFSRSLMFTCYYKGELGEIL